MSLVAFNCEFYTLSANSLNARLIQLSTFFFPFLCFRLFDLLKEINFNG